MLIRNLFLLFFLLSSPVSARVFEDACEKYDYVFLYLYTPNCSYCQKFEPIYRDLVKKYSEYKFLKVNASLQYGNKLLYKHNGRYVPYVVLKNNKLNKTAVIEPECLLDERCTTNMLINFQRKK